MDYSITICLVVANVPPQKEKQTNKQQNSPTALSNYSNSIPIAYYLLFVRFILLSNQMITFRLNIKLLKVLNEVNIILRQEEIALMNTD